jgi:nicotinamide-nucleotide amidase
MNAELITIGTELLLGQIVDTNAAWIAQRLAAEGVNLFRKQTVGDNRQRAADTIRDALARADVVLTTGGIGPTVDDMTREAIADATGRELYRDQALVERVEKIFARWGRKPGNNNLRQADLPQGAKPIPNPIGTAPGVLLELEDGKVVMSMPGVPREMKRMLDEQVIPYLRTLGLSAIIKSRILRTAGVGESTLDEKIADLELLENPTVGMAAHTGRVDIRITARAANEKEADVLIDHVAKQVRRRIGYAIFGEDNETLEGVTSKLLQKRDESVAIFETLTAGYIAQVLDNAGAPITHHEVGQPQSLPDEETAKARTKAFASQHGATWGLAVYSTEGDYAYGEKPGESLFIIVGPDYEKSMRYPQVGADDISRRWVEARAIEQLRRALLKK